MPNDKVTKLPVKFRQPPTSDGRALVVLDGIAHQGECNHRYRVEGERVVHATYIVRAGETTVECSFCKTRLDPIFALTEMAREESRWMKNRLQYMDEMRRLSERQQTKCECCGKMTRISKR